MKFLQLKERGRVRVRISGTEISALSKLVDLGLATLEDEENKNPLTTGERKAIAYWSGNPFRNWLTIARKRARKPAKPQQGDKPTPAVKARLRAAQ